MYQTTNSTSSVNPGEEYKLFLGCIPGTANETELLSFLLQYADIKLLELERRKNKKCSGYGSIIVTSKEARDSLLAARPVYLDRELQILPFLEKSDLVKSQMEFNQRRIVVAQLDKNTSESDLVSYFSQFGALEKTFVVVNRSDHNMLPYGHVVFADDKSASKVLRQERHYILGKEVIIKTHKLNPLKTAQISPTSIQKQRQFNLANQPKHNFQAYQTKPQYQDYNDYNLENISTLIQTNIQNQFNRNKQNNELASLRHTLPQLHLSNV
jgi:hypothetical protein